MEIKDFKLKWMYELCRGKPAYISNDKVLIPSSFFMKTCDLIGNNLNYHFEPKIEIGCCCTLLELGIVAVSERKTNGAIYVLSYPEAVRLSILEQNNNEPYSALLFSGVELLISLQIKNCYELDLWKWPSGERIYFLSIPLLNSEIPDVNLFINPLWWYQVLLQCNTRVILLEVKQFEDRYVLDASSYFFVADKKGEVEISIKNEQNDQKNFHIDVIKPMLDTVIVQSLCWLPESNILAATSKGVFKVDLRDSTLHKLTDTITGVSSMVLSKYGLFIGYKTGYIDVVNIFGNRWNLWETFNIEQPINDLLLSPDYKYLVVTTVKGSIFYRQLNQVKPNFNMLLPAEFGAEVAVKFIAPMSKICVVAKKNGFIHLFRAANGSILSTFQIDEEIVCLETSPICYCIVIGTNLGFLYFVDATDTRKPKFIHCERPYEISIDHLKFDNFGRYLVSTAQNQPIKIWNGLPSSGFRLLGLKKIPNQIKDVTVFCRSEDTETDLFILAESESGSDEEVGTILIRLGLPLDFGSDPKKYQMDVFGTLSGDALNFQERRLEKKFSKISVHESLGVIVYAPTAHKIQKYSIWSDFPRAKQEDMLSVKNVSSTCMSPDHLWLTVTDLYGCVYFYSCKELVLVASSQKYCIAESISRSSADFALLSNRLLCGRETGIVQCFDWVDKSSVIRSIPEWVAYCYSRFEDENKVLHSMEEEGKLDKILQGVENNRRESITLDELYDDINALTLFLNFCLEKSHDQEYSSDTLISVIFNDIVLKKITKMNRRKLPVIYPEKILEKEKNLKKPGHSYVVRLVSSFNLGFVTQNYSKKSIAQDVNRLELVRSFSGKKVLKKSLPNCSFSKSVKTKIEEERLETVTQLISEICKEKAEFNEKFDSLYEAKHGTANRSDGAFATAKQLAGSLPSKAERDFWGALVTESYSGNPLESVKTKDINTQDQISTNDSIQEKKNSIEFFTKSAQYTQEEFDYQVEALVLMKRCYDCKIYKREMKILTILLFAEEEEDFLSWKEEAERDLMCIEELQKGLNEFNKELLSLEKKSKDLYLALQKAERNISHKIQTKCLKYGNEKALSSLQKQPTLQLDDRSENPFWRPCPTIYDDLTPMSKLAFPNPFPNEGYKSEWASLSNKQITVLKIGVVLRNVQFELMAINNIKQSCTDSDLKLKTSQDILQMTMKDMVMMISKCSMVFDTLLATFNEHMDINLEGNLTGKLASLGKVSSSDHKIWKDIGREAGRIKGIQLLLEKVEIIFKHIRELKSEMFLAIKDIKKGHEQIMVKMKEELEEKKENFLKAKLVADEILAENRKSVFKTLKSRLLPENSGKMQ